jgi:hypothetical protein
MMIWTHRLVGLGCRGINNGGRHKEKLEQQQKMKDQLETLQQMLEAMHHQRDQNRGRTLQYSSKGRRQCASDLDSVKN